MARVSRLRRRSASRPQQVVDGGDGAARVQGARTTRCSRRRRGGPPRRRRTRRRRPRRPARAPAAPSRRAARHVLEGAQLVAGVADDADPHTPPSSRCSTSLLRGNTASARRQSSAVAARMLTASTPAATATASRSTSRPGWHSGARGLRTGGRPGHGPETPIASWCIAVSPITTARAQPRDGDRALVVHALLLTAERGIPPTANASLLLPDTASRPSRGARSRCCERCSIKACAGGSGRRPQSRNLPPACGLAWPPRAWKGSSPGRQHGRREDQAGGRRS